MKRDGGERGALPSLPFGNRRESRGDFLSRNFLLALSQRCGQRTGSRRLRHGLWHILGKRYSRDIRIPPLILISI